MGLGFKGFGVQILGLTLIVAPSIENKNLSAWWMWAFRRVFPWQHENNLQKYDYSHWTKCQTYNKTYHLELVLKFSLTACDHFSFSLLELLFYHENRLKPFNLIGLFHESEKAEEQSRDSNPPAAWDALVAVSDRLLQQIACWFCCGGGVLIASFCAFWVAVREQPVSAWLAAGLIFPPLSRAVAWRSHMTSTAQLLLGLGALESGAVLVLVLVLVLLPLLCGRGRFVTAAGKYVGSPRRQKLAVTWPTDIY